MRRKLVWAAFAVLGLIALLFFFWGPFGRGFVLYESLEHEIKTAQEIRIVEHSNEWDRSVRMHLMDPEWRKNPQPYKEVIFKTVVLDSSQRERLEHTIFPSLDYSGELIVKCFEPHHRIEFQHADGTLTSVEICFGCGNLAINGGGDRIMPTGWPDNLSAFLSSLGLRPKGPFE
jgi:hypothetical protein